MMICKQCGRKFEPNHQRQVTCSEDCQHARDAACKHRWYLDHNEQARLREKARRLGLVHMIQTEITCQQCGKVFVGRANRRFCDTCRVERRAETMRNSQRRHYAANREKRLEQMREYNRQYYAANRDKRALMEVSA